MLDRLVISGPSRVDHYHRTTITEHRAPTDESVRLLKEMQEKAEKARIATFHMDGNALHGRVEVFSHPAECAMLAKATFDLNGRRMTAEARVQGAALIGADPKRDLVVKLRDEMANVIATAGLEEMLRGVRF